jgi:hypothetical protein
MKINTIKIIPITTVSITGITIDLGSESFYNLIRALEDYKNYRLTNDEPNLEWLNRFIELLNAARNGKTVELNP